MRLRGYQERSIRAIREAWEKHRSTLLVLPTGCGKTITACHAVKDRNHGKLLWVTHREELIEQARRTLKGVLGDMPEVERADQYAMLSTVYRDEWRALCTTVQTQIACRGDQRRMHRFPPEMFSTMVIDEAHHAASKSYRAVVQHYQRNPEMRILGLTATPQRKDRKSLGMVFESSAFEYWIGDAISDGWLVPIDVHYIRDVALDFGSVDVVGGDLNQSQMARVLEDQEAAHALIVPTVELVGERKTLVFCVSVAQAEFLAHIWEGYMPGRVAWVCGKTPKDERRLIIERFREGSYRVLINVGVATEGFDVPDIEAILMARPTRSTLLYTQMLGRGTRPLPGVVDGIEDEDQGMIDFESSQTMTPAELRRAAIMRSRKPKLLVIDVVDNSGRHSLAGVADVLAGDRDEEEIELAKRIAREKSERGEVVDAEESLRLARKKLAMQRVRVKRAKYEVIKRDPFAVFSLERPEERGWQKDIPATDKQIALLKKFGVPTDGLTRKQASALIDQCITRRQKGLCTYKQARLLMKYGYDTMNMTFDQASSLITRIAANGWRPLACR